MRAGNSVRIIACLGICAGFGAALHVSIASAASKPMQPHLTLQICRMAAHSSNTTGPISIPRSTRFEDKDTTLLAQPQLGTSAPSNVSSPAPVILITTTALTLPQNRYCADVEAKPVSGTTEKALAAARGHLFAIAGRDQLSLLGEVYASLETERQTGTPASHPSR